MSLTKSEKRTFADSTHVGEFGETVASDFLRRKGFQIVVSNFKAPIGRTRKGVQVTGEIDLIAIDKEKLCFIEVKTRSSDYFASPISAVDLRKQRQIIRTAKVYRKIFNLDETKIRYDVVSVILKGKKAPQIDLIRGFWSESKFKNKQWSYEFF